MTYLNNTFIYFLMLYIFKNTQKWLNMSANTFLHVSQITTEIYHFTFINITNIMDELKYYTD